MISNRISIVVNVLLLTIFWSRNAADQGACNHQVGTVDEIIEALRAVRDKTTCFNGDRRLQTPSSLLNVK